MIGIISFLTALICPSETKENITLKILDTLLVIVNLIIFTICAYALYKIW